MTTDKMQRISELIAGQDTCVLATASNNQPHASLMTYFADHAAMKFYFLSCSDSMKSQYLRKNPHVSLLIDDREHNVALTIQGVFSPINKRQTAEAITKLYLLKHPDMREFADRPGAELIRVLGRSAELIEGLGEVFETKLENI